MARARRRGDPRLTLDELQAAHRACTRCVDGGFIPMARPVFSGRAGQRVMLVGQAPGIVEEDVRRPFAGRAGRQLVRWMERAGFAGEADFRDRVYITSTTTCFPGRRPDGSGDRRPTPAEVRLCAPWLDSVLELIRPRLVITVGGLAAGRLLGRTTLEALVGEVFDAAGALVEEPPGERSRVYLPLPHPSGQSRWLNDPERTALLDRALRRLGPLVAWAER